MMKKKLIVAFTIISICIIFFRQYIFGGKLLFPSNLLAAYYVPWNTFLFSGWEHGIPFKGLGHDNLLIFYPMKQLLRQAIVERSIPLWTPYNFSGGPLLGDGQSASFYPLTLLYILLPLPDAFSVMVMLVPFLTMIFTYALLRHFQISRLASLFGAVAFAFSGFMSVWMEENPAVGQSALWLPLLVLLMDLLIQQPKRKWFFLFSISLAVMVSSGFLQLCIYELIFLSVFGVFRLTILPIEAQIKWKRLCSVGLAGIIGILLVMPYLAPTWEAYRLSPRDFVPVDEIRSIFLVQWSHILSLFNPDWLGNPGTYNYLGTGSYYDKALFIGVIPLIFVIIGIFIKKTAVQRFLWWISASTLLLGFSSPFTQWLFKMPIPILSTMLPSRIFYITTFTLCIIAAMVFERLRDQSLYLHFPRFIRPVITIFVCIVIIVEFFLLVYLIEFNLSSYSIGVIAHSIRLTIVSALGMSPSLPIIVIRNMSISIVLTALTIILIYSAYKLKRIRSFLPYVLFISTVLTAWYFTSKSFYFGEKRFVYPAHPLITELQKRSSIHRIGYTDDLARLRSGANVIYGLYTIEGLNPVFSFRYGQLIKSAINGGKLTNDIPRISVELDIKNALRDDRTKERIQRLMSLLDVKYIISRKEEEWYKNIFPTHNKVWEGSFYRIWENPDVFPRAFVVDSVIKVTDSQDLLDRLYDPMINIRTTALIDDFFFLPSHDTEKVLDTETVTIEEYHMNTIQMTIHAIADRFVVFTDTYAPGWKALVDGKETRVYRTNFVFRGIAVPKGDHKVILYYQPESFIRGLYFMKLGIVMLISSLVFIRWKRLSVQS